MDFGTKLVTIYRAGNTYSSMARQIGVTVGTVQRWFGDMNQGRPALIRSDAVKANINDLYDKVVRKTRK